MALGLTLPFADDVFIPRRAVEGLARQREFANRGRNRRSPGRTVFQMGRLFQMPELPDPPPGTPATWIQILRRNE